MGPDLRSSESAGRTNLLGQQRSIVSLSDLRYHPSNDFVSIDLGDDTVTALREIAAVTSVTPDALIRRAVDELVADYEDGRIAKLRLDDDSDVIISSAELRRRLAED